MKAKKIGSIQKKILLLLFAGIALSATRPARKQWHIIKGVSEGLKEIDQQVIDRAVGSLVKTKLVKEKHNNDGTITLVLNDYGKKRASTFNLENIKVPHQKNWDGKWRIVIFDIPHYLKKTRESLRLLFKNIGFYPLQKSVFIYPFDCQKEIEFITEYHRANKFIRFIIADSVDNELFLRKYFNLL
ncbi:MAG: hypothetical protein A3D52_02345 [Candidatus Taylorbacteria bacterium RIFCSPHIGHO2_02_FULL_44_36]|uniref:Transcriptional repressor PaaX-like central Cas2-like domain-containing protein n=1 Tax=Candidatus Taylorbacteria bacterium RIFCSPLOWO2_12_FULL_44_15c TaxID=1802333 RepID=A0A1G2P806_9BACT|nr:MAG: hypothetical protein A3D52_02345 [Candidatus Taylorbacteria bacterium RIFCSPHIGHO2_02_FULL_44_36]OHA37791.1 MAG: hypothetical protein A3I97_02635 [Candidatus Taylorbacteria bacterium RIFCSPLOWO2_02_FULL_44_35]OHA44458.1 MAG: hypothetical protein A3G03_01830 [Candidatus Taylorbacteria bacterium RIFCSPLOWO2_12_FULL_44_15c]